jgi:hypothetical protein
MKLAIGLPVTRLVLRSKKRGFCFSARHLAAAGHIHVPGRRSMTLVSSLGVRGTRMEN